MDSLKSDIIIPDTSDIPDVDEFKEACRKHYILKNPAYKTPDLPSKEIFKKIDPNSFKEI